MERVDQWQAISDGAHVRCRKAKNGIKKDVFPTLCAFANSGGGVLFLGVRETGEIQGIPEPKLEETVARLLAVTGDPTLFYPPLPTEIQEQCILEKSVLKVTVASGEQVQRFEGRIYLRQGQEDVDITEDLAKVTSLYEEKRSRTFEGQIFPFLDMADLRWDLLEMQVKDPSRLKSWLQDRALWRKDGRTGEKGLTLAAVLLFGQDGTIRSCLPHYRVDGLVVGADQQILASRQWRTNLLETYVEGTTFLLEHLPEGIAQEADQEVRRRLVQVLWANFLVHRHFADPCGSRMFLSPEVLSLENPTAFGEGRLSREDAYLHNPLIAGIFREWGWVHDLARGRRQVQQDCHFLFGAIPQETWGPQYVWKLFFGQSDDFLVEERQSLENLSSRQKSLLELAEQPKTMRELMEGLGLNNLEHFRKEILMPLVEVGIMSRLIPDKPTSPRQKYVRRSGAQERSTI